MTTFEDASNLFHCIQQRYGFIHECHKPTFSCSGRCGQFVDSIPKLLSFTYTGCSCDSACQIYHDCCWDFKIHCPDQRKQSVRLGTKLKRLNSAKIECDKGMAVVTVDVESEFYDGQFKNYDDLGMTDFRQQVVYAEGLQMKNISTYNYFFEGYPEKGENVVSWNKSLELHNMIPHRELEDFFFRGIASYEIRVALKDLPPSGIKKRMCSTPFLKIVCDKCLGLYFDVDISYTSAIQACEYLTKPPRIQYASSSTSSRTLQVSSTPLTSYGTKKPDEIEIPVTKYKCFLKFRTISSRINLKKVFSAFMSFSESDGIQFLGFQSKNDNQLHLESLKLVDVLNGSNGSSSKKLIMICFSGFLFNGDHCAKPETLLVHVSGKIINLRFLSDLFVSVTNKVMDSFQDASFQVERKKTEGESFFRLSDDPELDGKGFLETELKLLSYGLKFSGENLTVITDDMIKETGLRRHIDFATDSVLDSNYDQLFIVFCLTTRYSSTQNFNINNNDAQDSRTKFLVCDGLFWYANGVRFRHFLINASRTPAQTVGQMIYPFFPGVKNDLGLNQNVPANNVGDTRANLTWVLLNFILCILTYVLIIKSI